jgi:hypothetical protein
METTTAIRLDLEMAEAGVLLCLMRLGMDVFTEERPDLQSLARLDRLPAEAFKTLAAKLITATEAMDQPPIDLDRLEKL